jgi:hypothetical protein
MTYLEDTDRYSTWNGSAWVPSAIGVGSGLVHLSTQTVGSGVSTIVVSNVFNSSYDNYKAIVSGVTASSASSGFRMTLNNSTGSTYFWAGNVQVYDGSNTFQGGNNQASAVIGNTGTVSSHNYIIEFFNPFLTQVTTWKSQFACRADVGQYGGVDSNAASQTGFSLFTGGLNFTGGTVNVYGYRKG